MDLTYLIAYGFNGFLILILGLVVFEITLVHIVAKAARMKNRSYRSFFWLSFTFSAPLVALVVASLPFNKYDKRSPYSDTMPDDEIGERYVNYWSKGQLVTPANIISIALGIVAMIVGVVVGIGEINQTFADLGTYN